MRAKKGILFVIPPFSPLSDRILPMFDQLFKIWFSEFGSREITTGGLMRGSAPLREILLRLAPDPNDRHSISSKHLGLLLAKHKGIAREGHRLEGRFVHKQWHWKLTEAPIDAIPVLPSPTRTSPSLVPRPPVLSRRGPPCHPSTQSCHLETP
jgi:hypothetical protein